MEVITLTTCSSSFEAQLIIGKLKNEGIDCFTTNEISATLLPHYNGIIGRGIQIMINDVDLERAKVILLPEVKTEICCPKCHSKKIKTGLGKNKAKKILAIIFSLFTSTNYGIENWGNICKDCGNEF